jgi:hypothetical protein
MYSKYGLRIVIGSLWITLTVNDWKKRSADAVLYVHPEKFPSPSDIEKSRWHKHINLVGPMVLIIVGQCAIWCGKRTGSKIHILGRIKGPHIDELVQV